MADSLILSGGSVQDTTPRINLRINALKLRGSSPVLRPRELVKLLRNAVVIHTITPEMYGTNVDYFFDDGPLAVGSYSYQAALYVDNVQISISDPYILNIVAP